MKVLQVIDSLGLGGAEVLLKNYTIEIKKNYHIETDICVLSDLSNHLTEEIKNNNIRLYSLGIKSKYSIGSIFRLVKLIKRNKYDVVHCHLFPAQYICSLASMFLKNVHFIFTEHSVFNRRREIPVFKLLDFLSYGKYKKIICCSELVKKKLEEYLKSVKGKTVVMYNGINIDEVKTNTDFEYDAILVGSLRNNVKGVDIFLKSIKILNNKISRVAIAGDGALKQDLKKEAIKLGIDTKVDFLGNRDDIDQLLEKARVFVLPSRWEGLPIALLEAMAKKKPIIATNVGGIPEVIKNNENGILIAPENEIELADKINLLRNSPDLAKRLGEQAYIDVQSKFSIKSYADNLDTLYNDIWVKR